MHADRPAGFSTRAIHLGYDPMANEGALDRQKDRSHHLHC